MLLSARRKDEVEEELTRAARRGRGECRLERSSPVKTNSQTGNKLEDFLCMLFL